MGADFGAISKTCTRAQEACLLTIFSQVRWIARRCGVQMRCVAFVLGLVGVVFGVGIWGVGVWPAGASETQLALRLACNDFPPHKIEHRGDDGLAGFDVDIVGEALKRSGWSNVISYMPWKRALEMTERGDFDGLCSCSHTKEREAKLLFSDQLGAVSVGLFARSEEALAGISSVADLQHRKVVTVDGYNLESELVQAGAAVETTSNDKNALDTLVGGHVDLLYGYRLTTRHFIAAAPRSSSIVYQEIRRNPYYFCLSRSLPGAADAMQAFNRSLSEMTQDGSIQRI